MTIDHPLQSEAWGEFKEKTGVFVEKIKDPSCQIFFHRLPNLPFTIGYFPKGPRPDKRLVETVKKLAVKNKAIFVKFEPNQIFRVWKNNRGKVNPESFQEKKFDFEKIDLVKSTKTLFDPFTFVIDISKKEDELLTQMHPKTRYNIRLAQKKGVTIEESEDLDIFIKLLFGETLKRQGFYLHSPEYFKKMWETLFPAKIARLLLAKYQGQVLVAWIIFIWKGVLYYPYGASTVKYKEVMASNLICWEAIRMGKKLGCQKFDMWGCLPPDADSSHPWYGFHRFKLGYGGDLVQSVGSWDLVVRPAFYSIYQLAEKLRWKILRLGR